MAKITVKLSAEQVREALVDYLDQNEDLSLFGRDVALKAKVNPNGYLVGIIIEVER
jgi:hypothetical protein